MQDASLEPEDIRVIDESGEDYIYPVEYFSFVAVAPEVLVLAKRLRQGV